MATGVFDALHAAIAAHHGKAQGKAKSTSWSIADGTELRLDLSSSSSDRPYTIVKRALGPA